ncbi:DUF1622 domain-containing protein [Methylobacterium brachiatum]|jgi:uncharacterized membrane protein|uniref:DUF1622 domain-containing protein n=1 Tax=Methylobacterium brachiatum TaxID=269660 RepID=UPI002446DD4B|nr:DUF1622 domain-containing protein [Methylobacterium brachiatum]MDH2313267.1 DUF1622 domain-containing protein [Methylobacterium brachiatum]
MPLLDHWIRVLATLIEFGGGLLVVFGCARGLLRLATGLGNRDSIIAARLIVADGIVAALGFKTAAALLKTIELRSWDAILMFVAVFALRTFVKQVLVREEAGLRARRSAGQLF